jgi:hypothetical protein
MADCDRNADVLVIATPWEEFRSLEPRHFSGPASATVIDCWRMLPQDVFASETRYITLGTGSRPAARMPALVGAATPAGKRG